MFASLIAALTRQPRHLIAPSAVAPSLALVPVSAEPVKGYNYGRSEIRRKALAARQLDRAAAS